MSYPLNYCIPIGETGIIDLRAQFMVVDTGVLVNSGAAIDTGFYEDGGYYYWEYSNHSDGFYGLVKFYKASAPSVTLGMLAINSREAENLDEKVSTRATQTSVNTIDDLLDTEIAAIQSALTSLATKVAAIRAGVVGRSVADDANDPTEIEYYDEDDTTVLFTHTLTDTERTVA